LEPLALAGGGFLLLVGIAGFAPALTPEGVFDGAPGTPS
jgi:hypothetical protein